MEDQDINNRKKAAMIFFSNFFSLFLRNFRLLCAFDEDDSAEDDVILSLYAKEKMMRIHGKRRTPVRLLGFTEEIVPRFSTNAFKSHFRMLPSQANLLENKLSPYLIRHGVEGRFPVAPRKQLLSALWLLATPDSFRSVAEQFGLSKGILHHCFVRVVMALNRIAPSEIRWPQGIAKTSVKNGFKRIGAMPDIVGVIDGCHIEIDAPSVEPSAYRTGKKRYAIQLQAVCTPELLFTDCFSGYPGSVHDVRVFRNSPLFHDTQELITGQEYIIGDKAYHPILTWCMAPYKNTGNLTQEEVNFNNKLSKTRQVIERAFALLKGRFRRLKHLYLHRTDLIPYVIMAACVLHNICLRGTIEEADINDYVEEGMENMQDEDEVSNEYMEERDDPVALRKRDYLRDYLWQLNNRL